MTFGAILQLISDSQMGLCLRSARAIKADGQIDVVACSWRMTSMVAHATVESAKSAQIC